MSEKEKENTKLPEELTEEKAAEAAGGYEDPSVQGLGPENETNGIFFVPVFAMANANFAININAAANANAAINANAVTNANANVLANANAAANANASINTNTIS